MIRRRGVQLAMALTLVLCSMGPATAPLTAQPPSMRSGSGAAWSGGATLGVEVKTRKKQTLEGAEVEIRFAEIEPIAGPPIQLTGQDGRVAFGGLAEGRWRIDVRREGYSSYLMVVRVVRGGKAAIVSGPIRDATGAPMRLGTFNARAVDITIAPELPAPAPTPAPTPEPPPVPKPEPAPEEPEMPSKPPVQEPPEPEPPVTEPPVEAPPVEEPPVEEPPMEAPPAEAPPVIEPQPEESPERPEPPAEAPPSAEAPIDPPQVVPVDPPEPAPSAPRAAAPPAADSARPPSVTAMAPRIRTATVLRSADAGTCGECKAGEWALSIEQPAGAGGAACPNDLEERMEKAVQQLKTAPSFSGALVGSGGESLRQAAGEELAKAVEREAMPLVTGDSCQVVAAVLPKGARYTGYLYEVADALGTDSCLAGQECPLGDSTWTDHPEIEKTANGTVLWGVFQNTSPDRERRARLTVYFSR